MTKIYADKALDAVSKEGSTNGMVFPAIEVPFSRAQLDELSALGIYDERVISLAENIKIFKEMSIHENRGTPRAGLKELKSLSDMLINLNEMLKNLSRGARMRLGGNPFSSRHFDYVNPTFGLERETERFMQGLQAILESTEVRKKGRARGSKNYYMASCAADVLYDGYGDVDARPTGDFVKLLKILFQVAGARVSDVRGLAARYLKDTRSW